MVGYADTGFLVSLYLEESTSKAADAALGLHRPSLALTPLVHLEIRNAFNLAIKWGRITPVERDRLWEDVESDVVGGFLVPTPIASSALHEKARQLSDRHSSTLGTRSLDLLHVAAALLIQTPVFFTFDERQRKAAKAEGLNVAPATTPRAT